MTSSPRLAPLALAFLLPLAACGPEQPAGVAAEGPSLGDAISAATSDNGMSSNGMSANGMSANGMSANGLSAASLKTTAFSTWFNAAPEANAALMKYVVRCAAPAHASFTYASPVTKKTYTWWGNLGVATSWTSGWPITTAEQQVVSACLAAHVNKFGLEMDIAVEGNDAYGWQLSRGLFELWDYDVREACFFGNLFTGEGIYSGIDHDFTWSARQSSRRACAFDARSIGSTRDCPPIKNVGYCSQLCQRTFDGVAYSTCTYGGKSYRALVTRISSADIGTCGDGRCDPQERCGTGTTWDSCAADCGACP